MKAPLFALLLTASALADVPLEKSEAQTIKSMDVQDARDFGAKFDGKLVRLKFNHRGSSVDVKKDGKAIVELYIFRDRSAGANDKRAYRIGSVPALFPAEGVKWIQSVTTHDEARPSLYVIARLHAIEGEGAVEVLGRQIVTDFNGSRVTW